MPFHLNLIAWPDFVQGKNLTSTDCLHRKQARSPETKVPYQLLVSSQKDRDSLPLLFHVYEQTSKSLPHSTKVQSAAKGTVQRAYQQI